MWLVMDPAGPPCVNQCNIRCILDYMLNIIINIDFNYIHLATPTNLGVKRYRPNQGTRGLCSTATMAVAWRSNAQQAGSQDLATVAGSEVRPSLRGWFSGTGGAGWFWGEN